MAFTPDDAFPLTLLFHTERSAAAQVSLTAAWEEAQEAVLPAQRAAAEARGKYIVAACPVPPGAEFESWAVDLGEKWPLALAHLWLTSDEV